MKEWYEKTHLKMYNVNIKVVIIISIFDIADCKHSAL